MKRIRRSVGSLLVEKGGKFVIFSVRRCGSMAGWRLWFLERWALRRAVRSVTTHEKLRGRSGCCGEEVEADEPVLEVPSPVAVRVPSA